MAKTSVPTIACALLALVVPLITAGTVQAQTFGRVTVVVTDNSGAALEGVSILATCDDLSRFRQEQTTNRNGRATLSFVDATKRYTFRFEHPDYPPVELPVDPEVRSTLAFEVNLSTGRVSRAALPETNGAAPRSAVNLYKEGVKALQAGDTATAKARLQDALEVDGHLIWAHSAMADVLLEERDYDGALTYARQFLQFLPEHPRGLRVLVEAHTRLGNGTAAQAAIEDLTRISAGGKPAGVIYNEGVAALQIGDRAGAQASFRASLELEPELVRALDALAVLHAGDEDWAQAAAYAERHLALEPGDSRSMRIRWNAYRALNDDEKANEAFDEIARREPKEFAAELLAEGIDHFDSGETAPAKNIFEKVLELDPRHPQAHYRLALAHLGEGEQAEAKVHLTKFLELAPGDADAAGAREMLGFLN